MEHIHILGICGTFMGSLAQLAKNKGYRVTGSDLQVYPPMSDQLEAAGIELIEGFDPSQLDLAPDLVVIGNVMSRGKPIVEAVLNRGIPYASGPQWFAENILHDRWVLAVSGTHGKTTTSSMLAWVLQYAGYQPGYLIGGVPQNFETSASLGESDFFVVEADEYDCAFFDKRSKFVHYRPRTLVINNLEYDHADIFPDLSAIQTQFHHLLRTVPSEGLIVYPQYESAIEELISKGCWTPTQMLGLDWQVKGDSADGAEFTVFFEGNPVGTVRWGLRGEHNMSNAVMALAAAKHVGVLPEIACEALSRFKGVKRRMELLGEVSGVKIYDDFAHHPTAIATTLAGLKAGNKNGRIIAIIEPRSNTMKMGVHKDTLLASASDADIVYWKQDKNQSWSIMDGQQGHHLSNVHNVLSETDEIIEQVCQVAAENDTIVIMSNGGFDGIHGKLLQALSN